jgi:hypothetical protein
MNYIHLVQMCSTGEHDNKPSTISVEAWEFLDQMIDFQFLN